MIMYSMHIQSPNIMTNMHSHQARQRLTSVFLFFFNVMTDANSRQLKLSVMNYSNMVHVLFLIRLHGKSYNILLSKSLSIS